jgi:hypothetical protein
MGTNEAMRTKCNGERDEGNEVWSEIGDSLRKVACFVDGDKMKQ